MRQLQPSSEHPIVFITGQNQVLHSSFLSTLQLATMSSSLPKGELDKEMFIALMYGNVSLIFFFEH
jgi:hypothetical protein